MNFADLPFERKIGQKSDRNIVVYALSTCGFCKKAMSFLDEEGDRKSTRLNSSH